MAAPNKPAAPPAPSKRGLPTVTAPDPSDDSPLANLQRLAAHAHDFAAGLHAKAVSIAGDGDLTERGQARATARHVAAQLAKFAGRVGEERKAVEKQRRQLQAGIEGKISGDAKLSEARAAEWRSVLRGLTPENRLQVLRAAAAGEGPAAGEIIATALTTSSPLLLGLGVDDPVLKMIRGEYLGTVAGNELSQAASLDQALADAAAAEAWLFGYAAELAGGEHQLRDAGATADGARPLASLTAAEKAARVAAGVERGDADLRDSLFVPAPGEAPAGEVLTPADISAFAALPLADKLAAGERGAAEGLSPAAVAKAMMTVTSRE